MEGKTKPLATGASGWGASTQSRELGADAAGGQGGLGLVLL